MVSNSKISQKLGGNKVTMTVQWYMWWLWRLMMLLMVNGIRGKDDERKFQKPR